MEGNEFIRYNKSYINDSTLKCCRDRKVEYILINIWMACAKKKLDASFVEERTGNPVTEDSIGGGL